MCTKSDSQAETGNISANNLQKSLCIETEMKCFLHLLSKAN